MPEKKGLGRFHQARLVVRGEASVRGGIIRETDNRAAR